MTAHECDLCCPDCDGCMDDWSHGGCSFCGSCACEGEC